MRTLPDMARAERPRPAARAPVPTTRPRPDPLTLERLHLRSDGRREAHRHGWHELIGVLDGCYTAHAGGIDLTLHPGGWVLYPAGFPHCPLHRHQADIILLRCGTPLHARFRHGSGGAAGDRDGRLLMLLRWMWDWHCNDRDDDATLHALPLLSALIARDDDAPTDPLHQAMAYAGQNLAYDPPLAEIARIAGLSPSQLNRLFRARLGISVMRWRRERRLDFAERLVRTTADDLSAIAAAAGFASASHLSRLLRRRCGVPPSALRHAPG